MKTIKLAKLGLDVASIPSLIAFLFFTLTELGRETAVNTMKTNPIAFYVGLVPFSAIWMANVIRRYKKVVK